MAELQTTSTCIITADKPEKEPTFFYTVRKHHKEIFKKDSPVSFFELLYMVEAPQSFTRLNIWEYVERIPVLSLNYYYKPGAKIRDYKLTEGELKQYPYYELFMDLYRGLPSCPLIFQEVEDGSLRVIEGAHRLRLLVLFYILRNRWPEIPGVVVRAVAGNNEDYRQTEDYRVWIEWLRKNSLSNTVKNQKELFNEFIREK